MDRAKQLSVMGRRGESTEQEREKGTWLNSALLTPKPLASSVYVHVPEATSSLKQSISVTSLFPSRYRTRGTTVPAGAVVDRSFPPDVAAAMGAIPWWQSFRLWAAVLVTCVAALHIRFL